MRLPRKWVLGLGLLAAAPGVTLAGPFPFLDSGSPTTAASSTSANPQQVAESLASALGSAQVRGEGIGIEVRNGTAVITGNIADAQERARVTQIAQSVPGVQTVDNRLTLPSTSGIQQAGFTGASQAGQQHQVQQVQHTAPAANNQAVAQQIVDSISSTGLTRYDIETRYKDGVASLSGSVNSPQQIMLAEQAARRVPGVNQVINNLTVNGMPLAALQQMQQAQAQRAQQMQMQQMQMQMQQMQGMPPQGMPQGVPAQFASQQAQMMAASQAGQPGMPVPAQYAGHQVHSQPNLPDYAWPSYAPYDNYAAVTYPSQYDASAFPYIGPFYPYPQVPMEWREARLDWDDGFWKLKFGTDTNKWWWFMNPSNWD